MNLSNDSKDKNRINSHIYGKLFMDLWKYDSLSGLVLWNFMSTIDYHNFLVLPDFKRLTHLCSLFREFPVSVKDIKSVVTFLHYNGFIRLPVHYSYHYEVNPDVSLIPSKRMLKFSFDYPDGYCQTGCWVKQDIIADILLDEMAME